MAKTRYLALKHETPSAAFTELITTTAKERGLRIGAPITRKALEESRGPARAAAVEARLVAAIGEQWAELGVGGREKDVLRRDAEHNAQQSLEHGVILPVEAPLWMRARTAFNGFWGTLDRPGNPGIRGVMSVIMGRPEFLSVEERPQAPMQPPVVAQQEPAGRQLVTIG